MGSTRAPSNGPTRWALRLLWLAVLGCAAATGVSRADEVDDALKLPSAEAVVRLEALLESAERRLAAIPKTDAERAAQAEDAVRRIQDALATLLMQRNEPYAALTVLEALVRGRGSPSDRVRYGEALVAVARANVTSGRSTAAGVVPYLQDALATVEDLALEPTAGASESANALRARLVALVAEAHYLLRDHGAALRALSVAKIDTLPKPFRAGLHDLVARCEYARQRWPEAAAAFEKAGNLLGAAAAWDAARRPARSVPLYVAAIRKRPTDAALIQRALAGARFTGAHGMLLAALEAVPVPEGAAGVPLLEARAELLEATGRTKDALGTYRDVASRAPASASALVEIGRLLLLTGAAADEAVWDEASDCYARALKLEPEHEGAVAGLSFVAGREFSRLWRHWRNARVVRRCLRVQRAIVEAVPDDALALSNLGNTLRVLGRVPASLEAYERAREANPFDPSVESDYGLALSGAERDSEALAAYLRSLELDPGHLAGRQNAARALWLAGEDERAAKHLGAAIRTARATGRSPGTYRFLLDRTWRTRREPNLR